MSAHGYGVGFCAPGRMLPGEPLRTLSPHDTRMLSKLASATMAARPLGLHAGFGTDVLYRCTTTSTCHQADQRSCPTPGADCLQRSGTAYRWHTLPAHPLGTCAGRTRW